MKTQNLIYFKVLILFMILFNTNSFAQWPQWRGPMRDANSGEQNLLREWPENGPRLLWKVDNMGDGFSSTTIQDNMVFTLGKTDSIEILTALDLTGNIKWQKEAGRASKDKDWPQSRSTPTIYKDKVYAVTVYGDIACFDSKTGKLEWKVPAAETSESYFYNKSQQGIAESPLFVDDKLIITPCGKQTTMVALNRLTGEIIWKSESLGDTAFFTSPVLFPASNKKTIFTSTLNYDILVDSENGKIIWKDQHISGMIPLVYKSSVYFGGEYRKGGTLCAWNNQKQAFEVVWKDTINANIIGGPVLCRGKIIVSGNSKSIYCIDPETGNTLSQFNNINYCNFIVAEDMIYCLEDRTNNLFLFKLNNDQLEKVSSFKISKGNGPSIAHMSISNGMLFVRHGKSLMAYDIRQSI